MLASVQRKQDHREKPRALVAEYREGCFEEGSRAAFSETYPVVLEVKMLINNFI